MGLLFGDTFLVPDGLKPLNPPIPLLLFKNFLCSKFSSVLRPPDIPVCIYENRIFLLFLGFERLGMPISNPLDYKFE